ncbi:MAG: FMN-binding protein, partial [Firmicutes bacterium]|nr:FMN-binding protein [Bacillota bacterium]
MEKEVKDVVAETTETVSSEKTMRKGTVLQAVKAIAVLVVICLVCAALLALCNDVFYISDAERNRRAEAKINAALKDVYPNLEDPVSLTINKNFKTNASYGSVQKVVRSKDGAYVIAAEGIGGYGGSIVVLVAIDKNAEIVGWKVSDRGLETWMDKVEPHTEWYVGEQISTDLPLLQAGATYSSTALNNAMKMASYYAMNVLNLGSNPEKDAKDALAALLADTAYADYEWTTSLDTEYRTASNVTYGAEDANVTATLSYYFEGTKASAQDLAAYAFVVGEEIQVVVVKNNVSHQDRKEGLIAKSEGVADAVVNSVLNRSYVEYQMQKIYKDFEYAGPVEINSDFAVNGTAGTVDNVYRSTDGAVIVRATGTGGY